MNNFYDIIGAIINNIFNAVMTGNMNTHNFASNEEMRIYGGGCRDCPSRMPSNHTNIQASAEEQRNVWLIILGAFLLFPCLACIVWSCKICYFVCKERICTCCDKNENNANNVTNV